jgi:hypothetical protein
LKTPKVKIAEGEQKANTYFRLLFAIAASVRPGLFPFITVETTTGLATEITGGYVFFQQGAGTVFRIAQALVEDVHDVDANVEADEVGQFERAHGVFHA